MGKTMTLEVLASIKGAKASSAVDELFKTIKETEVSNTDTVNTVPVVPISDLREDKVIASSETEKSLIKENFPKEKNGYLVVAKVID